MAPLPRGQRTLDGFFRQFTDPKQRDTAPSPSAISTSRVSGGPQINASQPSTSRGHQISSSTRAWQNSDATKGREAIQVSKEQITARGRFQQHVGQHSAVPQINGAKEQAVERSALTPPATPSAETRLRSQALAAESWSDVHPSRVELNIAPADLPGGAVNKTERLTVVMGESKEAQVGDTIIVRRLSPTVRVQGRSSPASGAKPKTSQKSEPTSANGPASEATQRATAADALPTSSLTTLPDTLSFSSTSTKRMTKDGVDMVMNSDTESGSEDSEPLEDLDVIIARGAAKRATPLRSTSRLGASTSASALSARDRSLRSIGGRSQTPVYKFTPASLLKSKPESQETADIDELRSLSDSDEDRGAPERTAFVDEGALEALLPEDGEDPGQAKRVLQAMQRADAFKEEMAFYYFDPQSDGPAPVPAFPTASLPHSGWQSMLRKPRERQQLISSGLVAKLCKNHPLPTEVLLWMLDAMTAGTSEVLSFRYLEVLEQSKQQLKTSISQKKFVERHLKGLAAKDHVPMKRPALRARNVVERPLPTGLRWFLELLQAFAAQFDQEALSAAIHSMTRILVDERVSKDVSILLLVQDTLSKLLPCTTDEVLSQVQRDIHATWKYPPLQEALVQSLPARSREAHDFRRNIAYNFAVRAGGTDALSVPLDLEGFTKVTKHVEQLATHNQSDGYAELAAKIAMLDVAIDAGFSDRQFSLGSEEENAFNQAVSKFAAAVRELESRLIGGGMSNLHKTTAKAALDRLWCRLQYSVRTTPPPQKDFFVGYDEQHERKVRFMSDWAKAGQAG